MAERNEIINSEEKIEENFNTVFTNIVSNLEISPYQDTGRVDPVVGLEITLIFEKYKNHPRIIAIKKFFQVNNYFNFETTKRDDVLKNKSLNTFKISQNTHISTGVTKDIRYFLPISFIQS